MKILIDERCSGSHFEYRTALFNILKYLSPKYCLEIGTHTFGGSMVFAEYFEKYQPEGKLITCDIGRYDSDEVPNRVYPVYVYPHISNVLAFHGYLEKVYYEDYLDKLEDSVDLNCEIISKMQHELEIDKFDFAFIDGDHTTNSFLKDAMMCQRLLNNESYILIDDVTSPNHELMNFYNSYLKPKNNFYEIAGMALIQNKEVTL